MHHPTMADKAVATRITSENSLLSPCTTVVFLLE